VEQVLNGIQQVSERGRNAKWFVRRRERTIWQVGKCAIARTGIVSSDDSATNTDVIRNHHSVGGGGGIIPLLRGRNTNGLPVNVRFEALTAGNTKSTV
jgi:hypothetical protein